MRKIGIGLTAALFIAAIAAPAIASKPSTGTTGLDDSGHKVTICHATSSSNPVQYWEIITVDIASSGGRAKLQGHLEHIEKPKKADRTDVIPPFKYPGFPPFLGAGDPTQAGLPIACGGVATTTLTLQKSVINDSGLSSNASAWTLVATNGAETPIIGVGSPASGPTASISAPVTAGLQYTLTETGGPSGYSTTGVWVCTDGTFVSPNLITLAAGENATCTITNDDFIES